VFAVEQRATHHGDRAELEELEVLGRPGQEHAVGEIGRSGDRTRPPSLSSTPAAAIGLPRALS